MVGGKRSSYLLLVLSWLVVDAPFSLQLGTGTASIGPIYISSSSKTDAIKINDQNSEGDTDSGEESDLSQTMSPFVRESKNISSWQNKKTQNPSPPTGFTNQTTILPIVDVTRSRNTSYVMPTQEPIFSGDGPTQLYGTSTSAQGPEQREFTTTRFEVTTLDVGSWTDVFMVEETTTIMPSTSARMDTTTEKNLGVEHDPTVFHGVTDALEYTAVYLLNQSRSNKMTTPLNAEYQNSTESTTVATSDHTMPKTWSTTDLTLLTVNDRAVTVASTSAKASETVSTSDMSTSTERNDTLRTEHMPYETTAATNQFKLENVTNNKAEKSIKVCEHVRQMLARDRYRHRRLMPQKAVVELKLNISQKNDAYTSWTSEYCLLTNKLLQASEGPLGGLMGRVGYEKEPRVFSGNVTSITSMLVTDYAAGLKNKTSILRNLYADVISRNLKARGIDVVPGSVEVQLEEIDPSRFCGGRCQANQRCHLVEDRFARWGVCTSNCLNTSYCLNGGICKFNDNGKKQCWCPATALWWFRGDQCEISESQVMIAIIIGTCCALVAFLLLSVLICMARRVDKAKRGKTHSWTQSKKNQAVFNLSTRNHSDRTGLHQVPLSFPSQVSIGLSTNEEARSVDDTESLPMRAKWSPQDGEQQLALGLLRLKQSEHTNSAHGLVQATSFRRINSRERAEMSSLHGEVVEVATNHQEELDVNMTYCNTMV